METIWKDPQKMSMRELKAEVIQSRAEGADTDITASIMAYKMGMEWQCRFRVGVQHFDIGPRYETQAEAAWMGEQLVKALCNFVLINTGVTLTNE